MSAYDHGVLLVYFALMVVMGVVFRGFVTDVGEYFRSGGRAVWWVVGSSAFMVSFSAWTFTGAASKAYADGWPILAIYAANAAGFLLNAFWFAPRFRRLRVVTSVEAIRMRFGPVSEQVFAWLQIPLGVLNAAIWLNAIGVFFAAVFGFDITTTILCTGSVVLVVALLGGSWAVLASDFIQALILMAVSLAVVALVLLRMGGPAGFAAALPAGHLDPGQVFTREFLGLWCAAMLVKQICSTNNLFDATRYLCVKDGRHARLAGLLGAAMFVLGTVVWFVPPMAARALFPDLGALFPGLRNPAEASFIAIAREVMPAGMMGLLASGMFAATMSSMDSGLNKNAGVFLKNVYQPHLRPAASDAQLLRVGRLTTLVLGLVILIVGLEMSKLQGLGLFVLMQRVGILVGMPIMIPLLLGLLIRRTPPWSAWSTVLVGFLVSLLLGRLVSIEWLRSWFGDGGPLDPVSREYWRQAAQVFANVVAGTLWFLGTRVFWRRTAPRDRASIDEFFARMGRPVDFAAEEGAVAANDGRQALVIGRLAVLYGGFVALLCAIPNPPVGRLAFLATGGLIAAVGLALLRSARRPPRDP